MTLNRPGTQRAGTHPSPEVEAAIARGARRCRGAAQRARPLRPHRLDRRQRLGPRARRRPLRHQAVRRLVRRPRAREHDPLRPRRQRRPRHAGQRAQPLERHGGARLRLPATCPRSAASCTPTRRSRSPGRRAARRSPASSRRWPTSSAARSRSGPSRSSATTRSAAASSRRSPGHRSRAVLMQNHGPFTIGVARRMPSRPPSWSRTSPAPCTIAREAGPLIPIPQESIDRLYDRYQNVYGQSGDERR